MNRATCSRRRFVVIVVLLVLVIVFNERMRRGWFPGFLFVSLSPLYGGQETPLKKNP
jgi:hypothetical protein